MTNIAEGYSRESTKEFVRFLVVSRSSTTELQSLLYVALSLSYVTNDEFDRLYESGQAIRFKIGALIRYLKQYSAQRRT